MIKEYKNIEDFPSYTIGEDGTILSKKYGNEWRQLKPYEDEEGYLRVVLYNEDGRWPFFVHQLVAEAFLGPRPSEWYQVRHLDGNKKNNHYTNLAWGTCGENIRDKAKHGKVNHGSRNGNARLVESQVLEIRQKYLNGEGLSELGREYDVAPQTIDKIVHRITWRYLT